MIKIKTFNDVSKLQENSQISSSISKYIKELFYQLYNDLSYEEETINEFTLEELGYIVILQKENNIRDLREIGLNPETKGLLGSSPEYVELKTLEDSTQIYNIMVIYDNNYIMTFIVDRSMLDNEVDAWLKDQAVVAGYISEDEEICPF